MQIRISKTTTIDDLERQLSDLNLELAKLKADNESLGQQILDLKTKLLQKGVLE